MKILDATERRVLMITTFVSACIALAPQEWTSAGVLLAASGLMFLNDRRQKRLEAPPSPTPAAPPQPPPDATTQAPPAT